VQSAPDFECSGPPASFAYNATGNRLTAAPHVSALLAVQYDHHLGSDGVIYGRVDYSWQSRAFYDPTNVAILSQRPYGLFNMAIGYRSPGDAWSAQIWAKNLADEQYSITTGALGPIAAHAGPPRTIGITLAHDW